MPNIYTPETVPWELPTHTGVYWLGHQKNNMWSATIQLAGRSQWLGTYDTFFDAVGARISAKNRIAAQLCPFTFTKRKKRWFETQYKQWGFKTAPNVAN
jgi:hypothetical protein